MDPLISGISAKWSKMAAELVSISAVDTAVQKSTNWIYICAALSEHVHTITNTVSDLDTRRIY